MGKQIHAEVVVPKKDVDTDTTEPVVSEDAQKLKDDLDDLLDEIDSVLEENAMEFVAGYIQKGGQ